MQERGGYRWAFAVDTGGRSRKRWNRGKYRPSLGGRVYAQIGQNVLARCLSIGVSHTYGGGVSHIGQSV